MSLRRIVAVAVACTALFSGSVVASSAQTPSTASAPAASTAKASSPPSSAGSPVSTGSPSAAPAAIDRSTRIHQALVTCEGAPFYSWPDRSSVPGGTAYPPAREGDAFNVIGDGTLANNGMTLYETTIDVVAPYGVGKHFYIDAACINAG